MKKILNLGLNLSQNLGPGPKFKSSKLELNLVPENQVGYVAIMKLVNHECLLIKRQIDTDGYIFSLYAVFLCLKGIITR